MGQAYATESDVSNLKASGARLALGKDCISGTHIAIGARIAARSGVLAAVREVAVRIRWATEADYLGARGCSLFVGGGAFRTR